MTPCDLSVPANVVGILLEVVGLLIVIQHDWQRERERQREQREARLSSTVAAAGTAHASGSARAVIATSETSSGHKVVERTEQERRLDDVEKKVLEAQSQLATLQGTMQSENQRLIAQLGDQEREMQRLRGQQGEIRQTVAHQQEEAGRREGWRFSTSLLAGASIAAGASIQIFVTTCV